MRIGILRDILVMNYVKMNIVLMVVSWMAKDTDVQPKFRRDSHGFWLANMAPLPRCTNEPYILPSLTSQVPKLYCDMVLQSTAWTCGCRTCSLLNIELTMCMCFLWMTSPC